MRWPLRGRGAELRRLHGVVSEPNGAVVLAGPAGVGKTRLAEEAVALARRAGRHTEWVVATASAATIPFGALAHLLPVPAGEHLDQTALLQRAASAIADLGAGAPALLVIDDAHLLDDASAVLVHRLAVRGEVGLVLTVRAGEPAPDPVTALWKDELAVRVDVEPLERGEVDGLAEYALGGAVERRALDELWRTCRGNVLILREVLQAATDSGALTPGGRVWELRGELGPSSRLRELLDARLASLPEAERAVAELLAVAEPLEVDVAERALGSAAPAALDATRVVTLERSEGRRLFRLAHPLYGDVLRERLPPDHRSQLIRRVADALESIGTRRRDDVLRLATWRLDSGDPADAKLLVRGAEHALAWADHPLAERLASAALATEDRHRVRLALGKAIAWQGRWAEGDAHLARAEELAESDSQLARDPGPGAEHADAGRATAGGRRARPPHRGADPRRELAGRAAGALGADRHAAGGPAHRGRGGPPCGAAAGCQRPGGAQHPLGRRVRLGAQRRVRGVGYVDRPGPGARRGRRRGVPGR